MIIEGQTGEDCNNRGGRLGECGLGILSRKLRKVIS